MRHEERSPRLPADAGVSPPARLLSAAAARALGCALQSHFTSAPLSDARWRRVLGLMCAEAHRHGVSVERLVVALKEALAASPAIFRARMQPDRIALTNRLVSICIEEYFADGTADATGGLVSAERRSGSGGERLGVSVRR